MRLHHAATTALALAAGLALAGCGQHPAPAKPVAPLASPGLPSPPAGEKWVGVGREVVAVPAGWRVVPGIYCPGPSGSYVTITRWHVAVSCPPMPALSGRATPPPKLDLTVAPHGRLVAIDPPGALVRATLPKGWIAVPVGGVAGGVGTPSVSSEIAALEFAGFTVERRYAGPGDPWTPVTTEPGIGTPARRGSTVVVVDHGRRAATATLDGVLEWVGGPGGSARRHPGTIRVVDADGDVDVDQTVAAGEDGAWIITVPPGRYTVTATSPGYLSAQGAADACRSAGGPVSVSSGAHVHVDVLCQMY